QWLLPDTALPQYLEQPGTSMKDYEIIVKRKTSILIVDIRLSAGLMRIFNIIQIIFTYKVILYLID
ncbi:MAG: hypothetical protein QM442_02375, partial [Spirochaetota bacterium]|nr:hypothetical protein [Spirochaetota bacterium]